MSSFWGRVQLRFKQMLDQLKSFFDLAEIGQSRSSITNPLQWMVVVLIIGLLASLLIPHVPIWVIVILAICLLVVFGLFLYAYIYFMHTKPDVLRSENFHLSKMAIEHGLVGDNLQGLFKSDQILDKRAIDSRELPSGEEEK